jgi:hypothetical protein
MNKDKSTRLFYSGSYEELYFLARRYIPEKGTLSEKPQLG